MTQTRMWLKWDVIIKGVYCNRILKIFYFPLWTVAKFGQQFLFWKIARLVAGCITKLKKKTLHWYLTPIIETTKSIPATRSWRISRRAGLLRLEDTWGTLIFCDWSSTQQQQHMSWLLMLSQAFRCTISSIVHYEIMMKCLVRVVRPHNYWCGS